MTGVGLDVDRAIAAAVETVRRNAVTFVEAYPDDATTNGVYQPRQTRHGYAPGSHTGWTTGFFAGAQWLAYELGALDLLPSCERQVEQFAARLADDVDLDHHDIGMLYTPSCVAAYRLTHSSLARATALKAADRLMRRYLPAPGIFQAWGTLDDPEQRGRTIIDSLMNLPLLFWATEQTGNPTYKDAATRHAHQLRTHFVRADGSTYHTYYFDPDSGAPKYGRTHQGHRDESTWSRGQAWALYGFALAHRYTREPEFLRTARRVADVFLANTPEDGVVYWDFDFDAASGEPRDSSASAIAACGLMELGIPNDIVAALYATCTTTDSDALILHGTQNRNTGAGVDEGNLWGDYFYLEALTRLARPSWIPYW